MLFFQLRPGNFCLNCNLRDRVLGLGCFRTSDWSSAPRLGSEMTKLNSLSWAGKLYPGGLCLSGALPISFLSSTPPSPCFLLLHPTLLISLLYLFILVLLIAFLKSRASAFPLSRGWVRSDRPLAGAGGNTGCPAPPPPVRRPPRLGGRSISRIVQS